METVEQMPETEFTNDADYKHVIRALVRYTSVPFLELVAITPANESKVGTIIEELERKRYVTIYDKGDPTREIVTIAPRRFDLLRQMAV
jgi:hypothetical protein